MRISFIGTNHIAEKFAQHIYNFSKEQQNNSGYSSLKLGGFYCMPTSEVSRIAVPLNCKIYLNLEDMAADNDIIGILCSESGIRRYANHFAKLNVKDKIFFQITGNFNRDVFNTGGENTYASICLPSSLCTLVPGKINEYPIVMEGTGSKLKEFADILNENGFNVSLVSKADANTFSAAFKMFEMNLASALSCANTAIMASTGISLSSCSALIKRIMDLMLSGRDDYINKSISKHLNALTIDSYFKSIGRLDMPDYTKLSKYACDICTRLSDISNDDKHEIDLVTKKYGR